MSDDLRLWLESNGLRQYADIFAANDIDLYVLRDLSDEDLKEMGLSLGHRRRLRRAIAELADKPLPLGPISASSEGARIVGDNPERQLTVLFCDLVGSTELSQRLDPEDLRELIRLYQGAVTRVVMHHNGYIANFQGDGIVSYFGWPLANEDEAVQAVRAGLDAVAAVGQLRFPEDVRLQSRVGISSGIVVVGDLEAAGLRQSAAVAGETPNLAARLQALAEPGAVVIGGLTRNLVGAAFDLEELGLQILKGIDKPVPAWRVLGERLVQTRFDSRQRRLTPFIGREQETALLVECFERAASGKGQAVLLSGEAGIGKSRLVHMLHTRLSATPYPPTRIRIQCSPFHTASALYPVIRHLEHAAGFLSDDRPQQKLAKLEALLQRAADDVSEGTALLAPLLSIPIPDRYELIDLTPEQRNARTLRMLADQLPGVTKGEPVLFIVEDVHWIDLTTRELIGQVLARISDARTLVLITYRPEFQSDWPPHSHVTALTLNRLSHRHGAEMVRAAGGTMLSEEVVERIRRRADGVPLYIEELTRSVVDSGSAFGDSEIPETLQASLLARLDRLGSGAKELAQIAAVIGREFGTELLSAVTTKPRQALALAFEQLITSQVVLPVGLAQAGAYAFRHALIQDAAYQSLLLSSRRKYHREVAEALETRFPETAEHEPALIAQHYTAAGALEQAIPCWLRAGKRALARYADLESIAHFERGLQLARGLPEGLSRSRLSLDLLLSLGGARLRAGRHQEALEASKDAADVAGELKSAIDLAEAAVGAEQTERYIDGPVRESLGLLEAALQALGERETPERCRVLSRLGRALFSSHVADRAAQLLRDASSLARRLGDRRALLDALICERITTAGHPCPGWRFPDNRERLNEMLATAEAVGDPHLVGHVLAHCIPAFLEMADRPAYEALLARYGELIEKRQAASESYSFTSNGVMHAILRGEFAKAGSLAERALELGRDLHGDVALGVYGMQMFTIRREQGRLAEVAPLLRRFLAKNPQESAWRPGLALIATDLGFEHAARKAFADLAASGFALPIDAKRNITLSYLAEVCTRLGDPDHAEQLYDLLLPYSDVAVVAPLSTVCCGSNSRYLGMLAGVMGNWTVVEERFEAALKMDKRLHAWPWLAHTQYEFAEALLGRGGPGDRARADGLLAAAAECAKRLDMPSLQQKIGSLAK
jgi:class 3 adenylate cyclase/tetratricopeptide (TPR) repeat protein